MVSVETVLRWLDDVADPEIPVLSITDLGIVRGVRYDGEALEVALTPTYSGCPATSVIREDVLRALRQHGVENARVAVQLAPAWTTDWLSERGRERLRAFGIAPPHPALELGPVVLGVPCPRCGSDATREQSRFGSTPCKALYRCDACGEPFEYVKPH
ncbi:MAG: 1,2-phenylacetyl-CoA epoxidase subunit PaaD [Candidatus Tyrphobacter sp.]